MAAQAEVKRCSAHEADRLGELHIRFGTVFTLELLDKLFGRWQIAEQV
jgi:hypothetical protein